MHLSCTSHHLPRSPDHLQPLAFSLAEPLSPLAERGGQPNKTLIDPLYGLQALIELYLLITQFPEPRFELLGVN